MKNVFHILCIFMPLVVQAIPQLYESNSHWNLTVSNDGRYLEHDDGSPFLYMADTGWEMLGRLTLKEADEYMSNRVAKGFNVIQTVLLTELEGIADSIPAGMVRVPDGDVCHMNPAYLDHVDTILTHAEYLGLYIAILPTWGDKVDRQWGNGPQLFDEKTAAEYGRILGHRWASRPNIIWIIGGDRSGDGKNKAIWNAMAKAIKAEDPNHLMTYHPHGEHSSSMWFHNEEWLDFNMIQSGHCQSDYDIYRRLLLSDMTLQPRKPVLDGEPRYEAITRCFNPENGRFSAIDVRHTLYQSMLSGACGYTYGNNNIWQMYTPDRIPMCDADTCWRDALDADGASQLRHFINLWHEIPFNEGMPITGIAKSLDGYSDDESVAFAVSGTILCYFPGGHRWQVSLPDGFSAPATFTWMNTRTGERSRPQQFTRAVNVLTLPDNADWLLIIRDNRNNTIQPYDN